MSKWFLQGTVGEAFIGSYGFVQCRRDAVGVNMPVESRCRGLWEGLLAFCTLSGLERVQVSEASWLRFMGRFAAEAET